MCMLEGHLSEGGGGGYWKLILPEHGYFLNISTFIRKFATIRQVGLFAIGMI